jgi:5,10-methylenetetrahydromethanopterin reductase
MEYGIALTPSPDSWRTVKRAEELGFTHAWFYDSQLLYTDVFIAMALAAEHTSRIRLGTGVLIPSNRIAPMAANCFASLNRLAPGRVIFGVGTGFTGRNTMGLPAQKLSEMAKYNEVVRTMLKGDTATFATEGKTRKVRFLNPENGMLNVTDPVPLHVSAFGPKGMALTAATADGWVTFMGAAERAAAQAAEVDAACAKAGRDPASLYRTVFTLGCVLAEGEPADGPRALAQAGPGVSVGWHGMVERFWPDSPATVPQAFREAYERYEPADARYLSLHKGHLLYVRDDERQFVSGEAISAGTLTGTPAQIQQRVATVKAAGYNQLAVQLIYGHEGAVDDWARAFGLR